MKSRAMELLDRAVLAMVAAIEIYNKPGFPYRNESFAILAINGWELLLKAQWLVMHQHKRQSLYIYERRQTKTGKRSAKETVKRTRSKAPLTHEVGYLARQLVQRDVLNRSVSQNILVMLEFRDCASHFYNDSPAFNARLYEIGAACVKNFANVVREWFGRDVTEFNLQLMPLTFMALPSDVKGSLLNAEESSFLAFLDGIDSSDGDPESPYSVRVNVELKFTKSKSSEAFPVQITNDPEAVSVKLTEENIREKYPWDYGALTKRCQERYANFKVNGEYHDIRKRLEADERFGRVRLLDPGNQKSQKKTFFNPNIMAEFDKCYRKKEPPE